jgi:PiT family inorganic phosphate transporter
MVLIIFLALATAVWNGPALGAALAASTLETRIVLALAVAFLIAVPVLYGARPNVVHAQSRRLQLLSAGMMAFSHGSNDAQKTMGIIWLLLISAGATTTDHLPMWVVISCYLALGFGTLFGGWRIVKTMGQKITKLHPAGGFCAETGGAMTLFIASSAGIPVSTTHTITGAIVGVGSAQKFSAVRWGLASNIVWAWVLTIPAAALMAALAWAVGRWVL